MTHAICIKCGAGKFGALSACPDCHYEPVLTEDRARSMLLSDHHYPYPQLDAAAMSYVFSLSIPFIPNGTINMASTSAIAIAQAIAIAR